MATLVWDQTGERVYQTGVDHGVLYLHDGTAVVWNGLIDIEESTGSELKSFYLDGVKYLETLVTEHFTGKLTAFTYPDEFDSVNGIAEVAPGLLYYDQPAKSFNLSYRTKIGDDILGIERGYKIHILYNVLANSDNRTFGTLSDSGVEPTQFSWILSGTPPKIDTFRPTVHIAVDSTKVSPSILQIIEDQLYGTATSSPYLPTIQELLGLFGYVQDSLVIIDNGTGVWVAVDESNSYITIDNETTFHIDNADATYIDADTYEISSTNT